MVVEPRQAFEDIVTLILKCLHPSSRRVRVYRGDGGIDTFTGTLGNNGEADVYQVKYFVAPWGDSQKQQIRSAYQTARNNADYNLSKWTLCVPLRLTKEDIRWFDEWRNKQDRPIELMDGDDLTTQLHDERCATARRKLIEWGVMGVQGGGPAFSAVAFIRRENKEKTGLTAVIILRLANDGDRSARGIKATITHSETGCIAHREHEDWEPATTDGRLNPRALRYRHALNPGDHAVIMSIPLCERSSSPFTVSIKLTAEDCKATSLQCKLTEQQITIGEPTLFSGKPPDSPMPSSASSDQRKVFPPTSPAGKEILEMILAHSVPEERGLTEILSGSSIGTAEALFIPNTTESGNALIVKRTVLRAAVSELVQLGWLLQPEGDSRIRIYELNPEALEQDR